MRSLQGLPLVLALLASSVRAQPLRLQVVLNIANCVSHYRAAAELKGMPSRVPLTFVLPTSDSAVADRVLQRLGLGGRPANKLFLPPSAFGPALLQGTYSRVLLLTRADTLMDFNLDELPKRAATVRALTASSWSMERFPLDRVLHFSSNARFAANSEGFWVLDGFFQHLVHLPFAKATGTVTVAEAALEPVRLAAQWQAIGLRPCPPDTTGPDDRLILHSLRPMHGSGDRVMVMAGLRTDPVQDGPCRYTDVLLTFDRDSCTAGWRVAQDTAGTAVLPLLESGFAVTPDDSALICQVVRFGTEDHPLFARYTVHGPTFELSPSSLLEHPRSLWEAGYQYNFVNGVFGERLFAFMQFPLLLTLADGLLHDLSADLGVSLDTTLAGASRHYFCIGIQDGGDMVSLLAYVKGKLRLVQYVGDGLRHAQDIDVALAGCDPNTVVLADHCTVVALSERHDALVVLHPE